MDTKDKLTFLGLVLVVVLLSAGAQYAANILIISGVLL